MINDFSDDIHKISCYLNWLCEYKKYHTFRPTDSKSFQRKQNNKGSLEIVSKLFLLVQQFNRQCVNLFSSHIMYKLHKKTKEILKAGSYYQCNNTIAHMAFHGIFVLDHNTSNQTQLLPTLRYRYTT